MRFFITFLIVSAIGLLVETRNVDLEDASTESENKRYGSVFRKKRSSESSSSKSSESNDSEHLTSAEAETLIKFFSQMAWEDNKESFLSDLLSELADSDSNITVVGWQNIYGDDGKVNSLNAISFTIPPKPEDDQVGNFHKDDDDEDEEDWNELDEKLVPHNKVADLRQILQPFELFNINAAVFYGHYNDAEKFASYLYLDANELYIEDDGYVIYNKTVKDATPEEIKYVVDKAKKDFSDVSILKWDAEDNLIKEGSTWNPILLGSITDINDSPSDQVIIKAPTVFTNVILETDDENDVPKTLAESFNKEFTEYTWRLIVNPSNHYVTRDVGISFKYDTFDFTDDQDEFWMFGVKKDEPSE